MPMSEENSESVSLGFRKIWITRINIAARSHGLKYSEFMHGLKLAGVSLNRKILSELAVNDQTAFKAYVELAKQQLNKERSDIIAVISELFNMITQCLRRVVDVQYQSHY